MTADSAARGDSGGAPIDSAGEDSAPCAAVPALDLGDGPLVYATVIALPRLREVQERARFGLTLADGACPSNETLPEEDGLTGTRFTGGCQTADGVAMEGELVLRSGPGVRRWEGAGWSVSAPDGVAYALDGAWRVEDQASGDLLERSERLEGTLLALSGEPGDLRDLALPMGFTGNYAVDRSTDAEGVELHALAADMVLPCRGAVSARFETTHSVEGCPDGSPDQVLGVVAYEGREARLVGAAPRACERCWTHEVDGVALGELCF